MKARKLVLAALIGGAAVLGSLLGACTNPATDPGAQDTGRVTVNIGIEGPEASPAGQSRARTLYPELSPSPFTSYKLTFTPTAGGAAAHDPVQVTTGSGNTVGDLVTGTYTIGVTAYTGSDTAVAEGEQTEVVITNGGTTNATVILGPKTDAGGMGTLSYDITVPSGLDSAQIVITTPGGDSIVGVDPVPLIAGQNTGTVDLAPGHYLVRIALEKDGEKAGETEIAHMYRGLTSPWTKVYTTADFGA